MSPRRRGEGARSLTQLHARNLAFATLADAKARKRYDVAIGERYAGARPPGLGERPEGLVAVPAETVILEEFVERARAGRADLTAADLVDYLRQWGNTMSMSSELGLPYPVQVDALEGGVRLGFVTVRTGTVEFLGQVAFRVRASEAGDLIVQVARSPPDGPFPSTALAPVMQSFDVEMKTLQGLMEPDTSPLGALKAALGFGQSPSSYSAYHIQHERARNPTTDATAEIDARAGGGGGLMDLSDF